MAKRKTQEEFVNDMLQINPTNSISLIIIPYNQDVKLLLNKKLL